MFNFFNKDKRKDVIKHHQELPEKIFIDIPFNNIEINPDRKPKEYSTKGYKYSHTRSTSFRGEGLEAKDFAQKLGIVYITSDNPNTKLINKVIKSLRPKPKHTGIKDYDIYTYNNGGYGYRPNEIYLYDESLAERISQELSENSKMINQNEYNYQGTKYRVL